MCWLSNEGFLCFYCLSREKVEALYYYYFSTSIKLLLFFSLLTSSFFNTGPNFITFLTRLECLYDDCNYYIFYYIFLFSVCPVNEVSLFNDLKVIYYPKCGTGLGLKLLFYTNLDVITFFFLYIPESYCDTILYLLELSNISSLALCYLNFHSYFLSETDFIFLTIILFASGSSSFEGELNHDELGWAYAGGLESEWIFEVKAPQMLTSASYRDFL